MIKQLNKSSLDVSLTKVADAARWRVNHVLADTRAEFGQFLTPAPIAQFMAGLFETRAAKIRILDPGAGVGTLTAAVVETLLKRNAPPVSIHATCYEIDSRLFSQLERTMESCRSRCVRAGVQFSSDIRRSDFIAAAGNSGTGLFEVGRETYDCVVMNPPYRKINGQSDTRLRLRAAGIETTNLYAGFMLLAARMLAPGGEFVSISPRSFCNGTYFRLFRRQFLQLLDIRHLHVFDSRTDAFKDDGVLQENIITYAVSQSARSRRLTVSITDRRGRIIQRDVPVDKVVRPDDPEAIIHIVSDPHVDEVAERMRKLNGSLDELGISVSTGRVVDFRAREHLRSVCDARSVPLIYPTHFAKGEIHWPKRKSKKPNAIVDSDATADLLVPSGFYVLTKRFSAKEEPRRVVAAVYDPREIESERVGFDNKVNYFHKCGGGMDQWLARGLAAFLNSSVVDDYFRSFSGHTQVNAADLRRLPYPSRDQLITLGNAICDSGDRVAIDAALAELF